MNIGMSIDVDSFISTLWRWSTEGRRAMERAFTRAVFRWHAEASKRVPVDEGRLKGSLQHNVYWEGGDLIGEVGTNIAGYPDFLEFGTKYIAGGAVAALGTDPDITDAQAVKDWPAKHDATTGNSEQMPWLRPAFSAIRDRVIADIQAAYRPGGG